MNKICGALFLSILLLFAPAVPADGSVTSREKDPPCAEKEDDEDGEKRGSPVGNVLADHGRIWTSPTRIRGSQWLVWGGVALTTGILIANDEAIYRDIKRFQENNEWVDRASPFFSGLCQGYPFTVAGSFLLGGWLFKDKKLLETGSLALQAMVHSFVVVQAVKHLTGRQRPSWEDGRDHWAGPAGFLSRYEDGQWARYDAFFSGHTVTIWSLATVIAHQYNRSPLVPVLCYGVASLGGLATITEDLHWISDVLIGAVVGYAIGRMVVKRRSRHWNVQPVVSRNGVGVGIGYVF